MSRHQHVGARYPRFALLHGPAAMVGMLRCRLGRERNANGKNRGRRHHYFSTVHSESPLQRGGFTPGLSIRVNRGGFTPGLSAWINRGGFTPGLSSWVNPGGLTPGLSAWLNLGGFPPGLSVWVNRGGFTPGLSAWINRGGFTPGLSAWVNRGGFTPGLSVWVNRGGFTPGLSWNAKAELVTAQHSAKAIRLIFMCSFLGMIETCRPRRDGGPIGNSDDER